MLEDAFRYQTQGDDWLKRVAIGGVVAFLSFFIIPAFTLQGYMLEVMRRVMGGRVEDPPAWDSLDLVETTIDGLRHMVVIVPYALVVLLLAGLPIVALVTIGVLTGSNSLWVLGGLLGVLLYLVGLLAIAVVAPIATANFVRNDSIAAGFDISVIRRLATNKTMLTAVLLGVAINIIGNAVTTALLFTVVGILAFPFIQFVVQSALFYVWARGFADAYEEEYGEPPLTATAETDTDDTAGSPTEEPI